MIDKHSCCKYYENQIGGDIPGYYSSRQIGHGWFSNVFRSIVPIAKKLGIYLGKKALSTSANMAHDIAAGENVKQSALKRLRESRKLIGQDVVARIQSGQGRIKRIRKCKKIKRKRNVDLFSRK